MGFRETVQHGSDDFPFAIYQTRPSDPKYTMIPHWHRHIEAIRIVRGSLHMSLDSRTFTASEGDIIFANSEVIHAGVPEDCIYDCLLLDPAFLKGQSGECNFFLDRILSHNIYITEKVRDPDVTRLYDVISAALRTRSPGYRFHVLSGIYELFAVLQDKHLYFSGIGYLSERDSEKNQKLRKVFDFISEHYAEHVSLEDMANIADLSPKYFCSFFSEITDTTPTRYLVTYRIERAAQKLLGSDQQITQIAFECGFNNLSYFIKAFRSIKGETPKDYRRLAAAAENL